MPIEAAVDPRTWRADSIDPPENWRLPLSPACRALLGPVLADWRRSPRTATEVPLPEPLRSECRRELTPALHALEDGRGFLIIQGPTPEERSPAELSLLYWIVGQALGRPFAQNVQGTLLYDVRDTGQDVAYGARFSVTNAESSFHTDNSFGGSVVDYVGLLCLQTARSGGRSQLVSGRTVYQAMREADPAALKILSQPFHFDRRGGTRPGEAPTARFPIVECREGELVYRYLRYWIETGSQKAGEPLSAEQVGAMDALDRWLNGLELRVEFDMRPGEMLFINNRWLLHNRTAFEDHPEPERRRHLVRLWVRADERQA